PVRNDVAITASGRQVPVQYGLVEAEDLSTSHDADGNLNQDYPQALQQRARDRVAARTQSRQMAPVIEGRLLDDTPHAAQGAPIITNAGDVVSGNGRSNAVKLAYSEGMDSAGRYRDYLNSRGYDTAGMENPVLVRRVAGQMEPSELEAFAREANDSGVMGMGAGERAMADAQALPDSALDLYRGGDPAQPQNRPFVRAFMDHAVGKSDAAQMINPDGSLSNDAIRRVNGALLAKAYGDGNLVSDLLENPDLNIRGIAGALTDAAPEWAKMRAQAGSGTIPAGLDQTDALLTAA